MRLARLFLPLGFWVALMAGPAAAAPHEAYMRTGASYFGSSAQTIAGIGPGVGYRYHLTDAFAVQADGLYLLGLGNACALSIGIAAQRAGATWRPAAGVHLTGYLGDRMRFMSSRSSTMASGVPLALELRLAPLRFVTGRYAMSLLGLGVGMGWDEGGTSTAYSLSLFEIGWRLE
jgi:hypothetical protein